MHTYSLRLVLEKVETLTPGLPEVCMTSEVRLPQSLVELKQWDADRWAEALSYLSLGLTRAFERE